MSRGGARKGSGRPKGSKSKNTMTNAANIVNSIVDLSRALSQNGIISIKNVPVDDTTMKIEILVDIRKTNIEVGDSDISIE